MGAIGAHLTHLHMMESDEMRQMIAEGVVWMAKDMPVEYQDTDRLPWEPDYYELKLIGAEEGPNKFYHDKPYVDDRTGEDRPADNPCLEYNWNLKFEVAAGEKKGDWLFVNFISKYWRIKKDGTLVGKLPKIALALDPKLDLKLGIDVENDLVGKYCRASIEPKDDGKYANVTAWAKTKMSAAEIAAASIGATVEEADHGDGSEIPF